MWEFVLVVALVVLMLLIPSKYDPAIRLRWWLEERAARRWLGRYKQSAAMLTLAIMKEQHPRPMARAEVEERFLALVKEHGSAKAALDHLRRKEDRQDAGES